MIAERTGLSVITVRPDIELINPEINQFASSSKSSERNLDPLQFVIKDKSQGIDASGNFYFKNVVNLKIK